MENPPPRPTGASAVNQYKGVRMRKWGKWVTEVRLPNSRERIWLGSYDTAEKAARAYDAASYCLRGTQAVVNFPADPPNIPSPGRLSRHEIRAAAFRHAHAAPRAVPEGDAGPSNARQEAEDVVARIISMQQEFLSPETYNYYLRAGITGDDYGGPGSEHDADAGDADVYECSFSPIWGP